MSSGLVLAIDQGTSNTKALVFDASGNVVASASTPMAVVYPRPGWAEQSALDIWSAVRRVIGEVVEQLGSDFDALAISNQRETIVVWDAVTGKPIAPAILWQCRRSAPRLEAIKRAGQGAVVESKTGLALDPLFPAAKIAWVLDEVVGARDAATHGRLRAGTVDSWLLWQLTRGAVHATDHSNASRTQLFNTETLRWDEELGRIFNVPLSVLPTPRPSNATFGETAAQVTALPAGIPIRAMIGDSHAALYGHGIREPGTVKATYGTGSSLMTLTQSRISSRHGLSSTIAWSTQLGATYALEGNISVSGQAAAYMAELLGIPTVDALAVLAETVTDTNGAIFVPALVGLGAPHWAPEARGLIAGLALGTTRAHLARAAVEAIAFQVADVFFAMEADLGRGLDRLSADGGATRNDFLMQFQSDVIGRPVLRGRLAEVSAAGAAMLARDSATASVSAATTFGPTLSTAQRDSLLGDWHRAVARSLLETAASPQDNPRQMDRSVQ